MAAPTGNKTYRSIEDRVIEQNRANQEKLSHAKLAIEEIYDSKAEELQAFQRRQFALEKEEDYRLSAHLKKGDGILQREDSVFQDTLQGDAQKSDQAQKEFSNYLEMRQIKHESDLAAKRVLLEEKKQRLESLRAAQIYKEISEEEDPFQEEEYQEKLRGSKIPPSSQIQPLSFAPYSKESDLESFSLLQDFSPPCEMDKRSHPAAFAMEKEKQSSEMQIDCLMRDEPSISTKDEGISLLSQEVKEKHDSSEEASHLLEGDLSYSSDRYRLVREAKLTKAKERLEEQRRKVKSLNKKNHKEGI